MKKLLVIFYLFFVCGSISYAQIGINTQNPQSTLDINGDLQLRNQLKVGTSTDPEISAGKNGQILTSQGSGLPPVWSTLELPDDPIRSKYIPVNTLSVEDEIGVTIPQDPSSPIIIQEFEALSDDWYMIPGLTTKFTLDKDSSIVSIAFETTAQSGYNLSADDTTKGLEDWLNLVGGIFIKKNGGTAILETARQARIISSKYPQIIYNFFYVIEKMEKGDYELYFAFQRLESSTYLKPYPLYIGTAGNVPISNSFMNKSYLRVNIYETK